MEQMYPTGYGLSAILGLSEGQVAKLVDAANTKEHPVFVGNINAPRQIIIVGSNEEWSRFYNKRVHRELVKQIGWMYQFPPIVLYYSLLSTLSANQLQSLSVKDPKAIYLANVNARAVRTAQGVAKDLADNIAHGVRWHDATTVACELGCELFLEVPPGHALSDLARENLSGIQAYAITAGTFDRLLHLARS
jgi:malonate decarboxylase epsilon subunit